MIIECPKDIQAYFDLSHAPHVWAVYNDQYDIIDWSADLTTARLKRMAQNGWKGITIEKIYGEVPLSAICESGMCSCC